MAARAGEVDRYENNGFWGGIKIYIPDHPDSNEGVEKEFWGPYNLFYTSPFSMCLSCK
jgi:hypothetical protein